MKKFNNSFEEGTTFVEEKKIERESIIKFTHDSAIFFNKLSRTDMQYFQCNRLNWAESDKIYRILPEKFLNKIGIPKQMMIPGGKIYV